MLNRLLLCFALLANMCARGQTFTGPMGLGLGTLKQLIEYEGQRFLVEKVHAVDSIGFDNLVLEKTIKEFDENGGFMLVMSTYLLNGTRGVILTTFTSQNLARTEHVFTNVHLDERQFIRLNRMITDGLKETPTPTSEQHWLKRFNERIVIDLDRYGDHRAVTLWVDGISRHSFAVGKWEKAYQRFMEFKL